jgi:hypothetical protein
MSDDILRTLSTLSAADRSWIIDRLSPRAKSQLLERVPSIKAEPKVEPAAQAPVSLNDPERDSIYECLERADATSIAYLLKAEPVWVAAALLSAREWRWHRSVLDLMPGVRAEIERALQSGTAFTQPLRDAVARIVATKVGSIIPAPEVSRFEQLIAKVRSSRLNRRLAFPT